MKPGKTLLRIQAWYFEVTLQVKCDRGLYKPHANMNRGLFLVEVGVILQGRQDVYVLINYVAVLGVFFFFFYFCICVHISLCLLVFPCVCGCAWNYAGIKNIIILWVK